MSLQLRIEGVDAGYGAVRALHGVSISVAQGETVALLGTNGNGKSTLLKCVMGMVRPSQGTVMLEIDGTRHDLTRLSTEDIVNLGVALVPEGRRLFPRLTVEENLMLGAFRPLRSRRTRPSATRPSRCSPSAAASSPARSPAASSRWWRSPARSCPRRGCW